MAFTRRRPRHDWTPIDVTMDVEAAFSGDPEQRTVRAAAVMRNAFERMKKSEIEEWEAAAAEPDGRALTSHSVFKFDFHEDYRFALYMDHDATVVIHEVTSVEGLDAARAEATAWVGDPCTEGDVISLPGAYLAAMIEMVTGVERLWNQEVITWWVPGMGAQVIRNYPPLVHEDVPGFNVLAMPPTERLRQYREFLASPSLADEVARGKRRWRRS